MSTDYLFTSESVSPGHPDKICDQISDAIVDLFLSRDNESRTAIECFIGAEKLVIGGEINSNATVYNSEIEKTARNLIKDIGYHKGIFNDRDINIEILLNKQSSDIALGVDANKSINKEEGAGDQGIMFGYACNEAPEYMPAAIYYAHKILNDINNKIKDGSLEKLGPDAKSQITITYENGKVKNIDTVLLSIQHDVSLSLNDVENLTKPIILESLPKDLITPHTKFYFNPTGRFVIGGPESDAGLTGRKIIVDTYGGAAPHGGGAFSGKDPTKVDRSAAYIARFLAKNVVASGLADKCLIQLSYAIGMAKPISFYLNSFKTSKISDKKIADKLQELVDLSPKSIRTLLQLNKPIYQKTATFGHFGRAAEDNGCFSWEKTNLTSELKQLLLKTA